MDYHDMSDDYKMRDYIVAITLQEGNYKGSIYYKYSSGGYGLDTNILFDIVRYIEDLNCEYITEAYEESLLDNDCGLKADINGRDIHFSLRDDKGDTLVKTVSEEELQNYVTGINMIRCTGHGKKKEHRKCLSCKNFNKLEGTAKGYCCIRNENLQGSRIICAFDYIAR